jgi:3-hydroxyisobutyrate dehydrogenase-like beta-hydroxyacid dehydrogenase
MGRGMVINLMKAGHELIVTAHRNRVPIDEVVSRGAREARSAKELAENAQIIFICVSTAEAVEDIVGSLIPHLKAGQIIVDATTSRPETSLKLAEKLSQAGVAFADAPMTGGPEQVMAGEAGALVGCELEILQIIHPLIACYCSRVAHFGPVSSGHRAKLISNYLACGMVALIADSYVAARRASIDWRKLYEVQLQGSTNSGALKKMVGPALDGNFDGYLFSIANAAKDMRYYCEDMDSRERLTPLAKATWRMLHSEAERGDKGRNVSRLLEETSS